MNEDTKMCGYMLADSTLARLGYVERERPQLSEMQAKAYEAAFDRYLRFGERGLDSEDRAALRFGLGQ